MGYDKLSYETDKDKVLQGFLDEIKKRDFESRLDREAIELRDAEIERLNRINKRLSGHVIDTDKINETLRAQVEELTREVDMYNGITLGEVVKERDQLQRVNDLVHQQLGYAYTEHAEEMQELRTEIERRGGYMDELAEEVDRLREELRLERADHYATVQKLGNRAVNAEQMCDQLRILNGKQVFEIEKYASEVLELREKLASAECDLDTVDQENIYLDAQREVLQKRLDDAYSVISHLSAKPVGPVQELPKQPTIVNYFHLATNYGQRRFNIYSDGTVTCTLESIGEKK